MRVTSNSGDSMVVQRAQESTSAVAFSNTNSIYYVSQNLTKKFVDDIRTNFTAVPTYVEYTKSVNLGSNFGASATNYGSFSDGASLSTSASNGTDINHSILGVTGQVVGLIVNYRANNKTGTDTVHLWVNNATSGVKAIVGPTVLNAADTVNTVTLSPFDRLQVKLVNSGGSGTSTGISVAIRVRKQLQ
jgi:hypothetical protein